MIELGKPVRPFEETFSAMDAIKVHAASAPIENATELTRRIVEYGLEEVRNRALDEAAAIFGHDWSAVRAIQALKRDPRLKLATPSRPVPATSEERK